MSYLRSGTTEFGYGLSYTTFKYSDLKFDNKIKSDDTSIMSTAEPFEGYDGKNSLYDVIATYTATITNIGKVKGSEVAQLYVSIPEKGEPIRVLRGFDKVKNLAPGASGKATFELRRKDLSVSLMLRVSHSREILTLYWHRRSGPSKSRPGIFLKAPSPFTSALVLANSIL